MGKLRVGSMSLIILCMLHTSTSLFMISASNTSVVEGSSVELHCTSDMELMHPFMSWIRADHPIRYSFMGETVARIDTSDCHILHDTTENREYRYNCTGEPPRDFYLTIPSVSQSLHDVWWACTEEPFHHVHDSVALHILVPVPSVNVTSPVPNKVEVLLGSNQVFTCQTGASRPAGRIEWYKDGENVTENSGTQSASGDKFITVSSLTLVGTENNHEATIHCEATNGYGVAVESETKTVYVVYKPSITLVSVPTSPVHVSEGRQLTLTCTVDSYPPSVGIWSRMDGKPLSGKPQINGLAEIPEVSRQDSGVYTCSATNSQGTTTQTIPVDVYYPSDDITIQYSNTTYLVAVRQLRCVPTGNPGSFTFSKWKHMSTFGELIRELDGVQTNLISTLSLPDLGQNHRYEDTGSYICNVTNGIPDNQGRLYHTKEIYFEVGAPPIFVSEVTEFSGQVGQKVTIQIPFYSTPAPTAVYWRNFSSPQNIQNTFNYTRNSHVNLKLHGKDVDVFGYEAILVLKSVAATEVGSYEVTAMNPMGSQHLKFSISTEEGQPKVADGLASGVILLSIGSGLIVIAAVFVAIAFCLIRRQGCPCRKAIEERTDIPMSNIEQRGVSGGREAYDESMYEEIDQESREAPNIYTRRKWSKTEDGHYRNQTSKGSMDN